MEALVHNDFRQQPITSDEACGQYHVYLARLEAMIAGQEDAVLQVREADEAARLANARTSLWRLLTKRQGVLDTVAAHEQGERSRRSA
jgi:hypothetical protein